MIIEFLAHSITIAFFFVVLSYYLLLFKSKKRTGKKRDFDGITIIIPAHNEELVISKSIESAKSAYFKNKQIIVVDDGSTDKTFDVARTCQVQLIRQPHSGKSASINKALKLARHELVAIVDADSFISRNSLIELSKELYDDQTAAVTTAVLVKNRTELLGMWMHIDQIYNSLLRSMMSRINANITTPGPLSIYKKKCLDNIGGFSTDGFSEDVDVSIRLIRKGYHISFCENAFSETVMPTDPKGFLRQRTRFARGTINIFKKHLTVSRNIIDLYTLPLFLFGYVQAVIMGSFIIYQIISGYWTYFASKGVLVSTDSALFLIGWLSVIGTAKWALGLLNGSTPLTLFNIAGIISTLMTYPLYIYAILKYDKKIDIYHLIPLFFMFPYWLIHMVIYTTMLPEVLAKNQPNIWKKNEK
ncbi:glycosyltransferase family 2 protein [Candidatus Woesearchaeota archaeon]|nr:glycosyltransferase family 2 protein [Candidatus Woesearchaeota archaeon]